MVEVMILDNGNAEAIGSSRFHPEFQRFRPHLITNHNHNRKSSERRHVRALRKHQTEECIHHAIATTNETRTPGPAADFAKRSGTSIPVLARCLRSAAKVTNVTEFPLR
jgi:hypothetical protein